MEPKKMYIDGEWVTGSMEKPFDVINPATGEVLAQVCGKEIILPDKRVA